ncbi:tyrosine-type recombinase/integrase [Brevibacillus agri]|uniref:tyrosine-type recombinase/integrase n=1 Tax=Brevibacillus agri TaxID=51101 RepID=UPI003D254BAC
MALKKRERRTNVSYPSMTLQQALEMVIASKKAEGLRERTLADYVTHYGYFVRWLRERHSEVEYVHELTAAHFRGFITYMREEAHRYEGHRYVKPNKGVGLADTTINIRLRSLRTVFNYLARDGLIASNPMQNVKMLRQDIDLTDGYTDEEVRAILAQPDQRDYSEFRDYVAMTLLLDTGIRRNELLSLSIGDIDFQTRFIMIAGDVAKNRKARLVPISAHTAKLILQLIGENREHFETDKLFLSAYGDPLSPNHFNKRLKLYAQRAGITGKKTTAHVWRHTWARIMVTNGADPFTIQKIGGWSDIRIMRHYLQLKTEDMRSSHDAYSPVNKFVKKRRP